MSYNGGIKSEGTGRFIVTNSGKLTVTEQNPQQNPQQLTYNIRDIIDTTIDNPPNSGNTWDPSQAIVYIPGSKYIWSPRLDYTNFYAWQNDSRLHLNNINFNTQGKGYRIKLTGITTLPASVDTWVVSFMRGDQTPLDIGNANETKGFGMILIKKSGSIMQIVLRTNTGVLKASVNTNFNDILNQGDTWELEIIRDINDNVVVTLIKNGNISYSVNTLYTNLRNTISQNQTFTFADVGGFFINWYGKDLTNTRDIEAEIVEI